jgi:hypothetical protein
MQKTDKHYKKSMQRGQQHVISLRQGRCIRILYDEYFQHR